ncbi:MAG: DNA polymerase III subunit delta [Candidatus Merdivicinus sp.]|jgi:DNA polymerase-3 subunit delta
MPYMTDAELSKSLRQNELFPVYFLYGKETFLSAAFLDRILEKAVPKGTESLNLQKFDGADPDLVSLQVAAEGMPLMAARKAVLFSNPNLEKMKKDDFDALLGMVQDPNPTTVFIIYVSAFELNPKKMSRVKKFADAVSKSGVTVDFAPRTQSDLVKFIKAKLQKSGVRIETPAASFLIERCGSSLDILDAETEKLAAYREEGEISRADIEAVTHPSLEASVFDLSKWIIQKNATRAFAILEDLFTLRQEPIAILAVLNSAFLDLYRAKAALLASKTEADVAALYPAAYRGKEFRIRNAFRDAGRISILTLRECLSILAEADVQLKSQRCEPQAVAEQVTAALLAQIAGGTAR